MAEKIKDTEKPSWMLAQVAACMRSIVELDGVPGEVRAGLLKMMQSNIVGYFKAGIFDYQMLGSMLDMNYFCMEKISFPTPDLRAANFESITSVK